jgi:UDP-N-acetylmuramoyl-L-alanyl-D-glutamate--2,6-diaminopimelate ligase
MDPAAQPSPSLTALLQGLAGERVGPWDGVEVTGIAVDSRRVLPGYLFAALPGTRAHGVDYVADALARGAKSLILPRGTSPPPGVAALLVDDPRAAVSAAAAAFYGHPSTRLHVIGVTGSNGKTTTVCMVAQVFTAAGRPAAWWSTNEVFSGKRRFRPALTTPDAPGLQRFLREAVDAGMSAAAIEVSSHAAEQRRVEDVRFAGGVVTMVSPDHLDYHGSFAAYLAAKRRFIQALPPEALCVFNADDPGARAVAEGTRARRLTFGFSPGADLRAADPEVSLSSSRCTVHIGADLAARLPVGPGPLRLTLPLAGRHNLLNGLAALAVALDAGIPATVALDALASFVPPARRLAVRRVGPYVILDDVAMNEGSFDAVFATVAELGCPQLVVVVALRGNRGPEVNARVATTLARWDRLLHFGPVIATLSCTAVARYSLDYQVRPEEAEAFAAAARAHGLEPEVFPELADAVAAAVRRLRPGGTLLLLGTFGMDDGADLACRLLGSDEAAVRYPEPSFE